MAKRIALLVGNSIFNNTNAFPVLRSPLNDAQDFAFMLREHGKFEIQDILLNATAEAIRRSIDDLFSEVERGDLALLYYSGHGYRDQLGQHYLVAKDSQPTRMRSTGVAASFIQDAMRSSRSRHRIIVLDCCFSGAFIQNRKSGTEPLLLEELKGEATAILASSGMIQYSFEETGRNSLFTDYLLRGVKTGEADEDEDGRIAIDELFRYADRNVRAVRPEQTPMQELSVREGEVFIALNPRGTARLPRDIEIALQSDFLDIRLAAINQLGNLARGNNIPISDLSRDILVTLTNSQDAHIRTKATEIIKGLPAAQGSAIQIHMPLEPEMVYVPEGPFVMGISPEEAMKLGERFLVETPEHTVHMPAFSIGRYPITVAQYKTFINATQHRPPDPWKEGRLPQGHDNHPVVQVGWKDASDYCAWLRTVTGKPYRLPTEAEWEKAARGTDSRRYPWGNEWNARLANTKETGHGTTTPVGQYSPDGDSPYGCADMSGNVWEWTDSLLGPYPGNDHKHKDYGMKCRVLRGGAFLYLSQFARCATRGWTTPDYWVRHRGFRVALTTDGSQL